MIERKEKQDVWIQIYNNILITSDDDRKKIFYIQIYKDKLIMNDDDWKKRERRTLTPVMIERREKEDIEIQIYKDKLITPPPHYMDWRENTPRKIPRISPESL